MDCTHFRSANLQREGEYVALRPDAIPRNGVHAVGAELSTAAFRQPEIFPSCEIPT